MKRHPLSDRLRAVTRRIVEDHEDGPFFGRLPELRRELQLDVQAGGGRP